MSESAYVSKPAALATKEELAVPPAMANGRRYDRSIIEGPLLPAVWKIAWPTMLTNMIGGIQGVIDHMLVGNLVAFLDDYQIPLVGRDK